MDRVHRATFQTHIYILFTKQYMICAYNMCHSVMCCFCHVPALDKTSCSHPGQGLLCYGADTGQLHGPAPCAPRATDENGRARTRAAGRRLSSGSLLFNF